MHGAQGCGGVGGVRGTRGGAGGQGVGQDGSGCVAIVNVGCGCKLTGLSVCNLNGCDTKRPLVTLLAHYGEERRGGEGRVINFSNSEPSPLPLLTL